MTVGMPKWKKEEVIYHPTIFGAACWANCALHPINKSL
jgi:hypothetical protein